MTQPESQIRLGCGNTPQEWVFAPKSWRVEASRDREKAELKEERRRLWEEQVANERNQSRLGMRLNDEHRLIGIASTRSLLKFLLD